MTKIKDAVGAASLNNKVECAYIQILLNTKLAKTQGFTKLVEDGLCGTNTIKAIRTFQQTVAKMYHVDGRVDPDKHTFNSLISGFSSIELTACWNKAVMTQNKGLIIDEQAKRAQAKNQALPIKLVPTPDYEMPSTTEGFSFPLDSIPRNSFTSGDQAFESSRSKGARKHAGCDLIMPPGEPVYAIAAGKVRQNPYYFYDGTFALEIKHGAHVVRYGELLPSAAAHPRSSVCQTILPHIKEKYEVSKGELIGYVGLLKDVGKSMLHFEIYKNSSLLSPLTDQAPGCTKFKRRKDLMNPTNILNAAKSSLPAKTSDRLDAKTVTALVSAAHSFKR